MFEIRGKKVMLDRDLAKLYGVETRVLNQAVKRNLRRFPEDFMFKLTGEEVESLRSQFVTLNKSDRRGKHRKYLPYVFTEQGVAMLSSVLNSSRAIQVNIRIMRAFVELRYALSLNSRFDIKLKELESRIDSHDNNISDIFEAIRQLVGIPHERRKIKGFAS
ncbi:MAG: ORF6N domain-containing protein [Candidatus Omnitrophica bacterium]|nr:ORF6N domain-containing protein [Candidatus Omnitrophota bacterium]